MSKLNDFLAGVKVLEEANSKFNGKVTVVTDLAWGTHIKAGGITQSGGVVTSIWKTTFKEIPKLQNSKTPNTLVLGVAGGDVLKLIRKNWPKAKITGVDIDPVIVEMGKKHMKLDEINAQIIIKDAIDFVKIPKFQNSKTPKFDLIIVDVYLGRDFPSKFATLKFTKKIKSLLARGGIAIFNRLYYDEKKGEADKFFVTLKKTFPKITKVFPEANIMFVCEK